LILLSISCVDNVLNNNLEVDFDWTQTATF
jgi:hypothetical protein